MFELDSVWLVESIGKSNNIIDVTDLEGTLYQHDQVLQHIEENHH